MSYQLTRLEQETIVNSNAEEKMAEVYTADPVFIRKLDKMVEKYPETYKVIKQDEISKTYQFPKKLIRFGAPVTRVYTEEEKAKLRAQLDKFRK
jgi:hypothetical protein